MISKIITAAVAFSAMTTAVKLDVDYSHSFRIVENEKGCPEIIYNFNPLTHKPKYKVAIFTTEGKEIASKQYNMTFGQYLTATAGQRFNPPIQFEMVPMAFTEMMNLAAEEEIDFTFAASSVSSCLAVENKGQPLVTVINRREDRGYEYDLDVYGGVMFTLADNDSVVTMNDFKDKIIGAGSITSMGGGQTQFFEMVASNLSYVADPKQVVFTNDAGKVIDGVLNGEFDVGFVRTDQIERFKDANGNLIDPEKFKIINAQTHRLDNGKLFPFSSSTGLNPEWPVMALDHVHKDVAREVQDALLGLREHYASIELNVTLRCDTTKEIAELAKASSMAGSLAGFRPPRSYASIRTKQERAGFLRTSKDGKTLQCIRGESVFNDVICPEGMFKLGKERFLDSCKAAGLECKEGFECYCKPCIKAYEVDLYQWFTDSAGNGTSANIATIATDKAGCDKMSVCGVIQQTKPMSMRLRDNMKRVNPDIVVKVHLDDDEQIMNVHTVEGEEFVYEFQWVRNKVGVEIMEVFFDGVQIPESPVRIQVDGRQCDIDFPGEKKSNTANGDCECSSSTMDLRGKCVDSTIVAVVISILAVLVVLIVGVTYVRYKNHKNDQIWHINIDELQFDDPVEIIGQGSFGVVLLGEYRGTKVALKRALRVAPSGSKRASKARRERAGGSRASANTDSQGMSSVGTDDIGDADPQDAASDPEAGSNEPADGASTNSQSQQSGQSHQSGGGSTRKSHGSFDPNSLGFLNEDFGPKNGLAAWIPWLRNDNYQNRFKQAILGDASSGGAGSMTKTWHAILCPWFDPYVRAQEDFICEMRVLSRLRHPCITTVMGAVIGQGHDPMLVMEYMEYGSLFDLLRNETLHLSGEIILQIARDIAQGLRFLHSSKPPILHGDLKGRNILIDSRFRAKLCDFGLSTKKLNKITGTPFWLAPEYLRGQTVYNTHCDMYSVGIVIYEIYARKNPYAGEDFRDTLRRVCDRRVNKRPEVPETCPPKMVDLMKKCWSPDPFCRPQAKDLDTILLDMNVREAEPLTPEQQLQAKKKRTGDMIYELFPKHIADALKAGQKVEPEQHDKVTVVFSDIVHFTDISRNTTPLKISNMLDRLYNAFDTIAKEHEVFKVETIGDAYMGVTNLEKTQEDTHAKNAALFAIAMVKAASKILIDEEKPELGYINIRVGFHSGPVVSNVVGSLNPRYGLFGDTVNTASRMETNSKANRILCSEAAYEHLEQQAPEISAKKRGKISVKGKGEMVVFWIGDQEISESKRASQNIPVSEFDPTDKEKHVEFIEPGEELDEQVDPKVDDRLWRKDLQTKIQDIEEAPVDKVVASGKAPMLSKVALIRGKAQKNEAAPLRSDKNVVVRRGYAS